MPISNFLSGNSIVESTSQGVRDQGYLYALQRQLRAEDQKFVFDQQANPLRLDALREDLYKARLDNQFTAATQQFRVDQAAAQSVITGAKARYADVNERAGAVSALQTVAMNDQVLQSQGYSLVEQQQDLAIKYPIAAQAFVQGRQNITDAGGTAAPDGGVATALSNAAGAAGRAVSGEGPPLPGRVRSYSSLLYDTGSPLPASVRPAGNRAELEAGLASLTRQAEDFEQQGPMYRQFVNTFGVEAARTQTLALRAARDATDTSLRAITALGDDKQRADNATLSQQTENLRLQRENEELRLQLSRAQGAPAAPAARDVSSRPPERITPVDPDVAIDGVPRSDPLAKPKAAAPAAPVDEGTIAPSAATAVGGPAERAMAAGMPAPNPGYTAPRPPAQGQPLRAGVIYADPNRENPVIDLGEVVVREGTPAGFDFGDERDPPIVSRYEEGDDGEVIPVLTGNGSHIFKAMLTQESGNRQVDSRGRPITSPAGAIGIAQVMPATAREQARYMGIPWDERRYKYDSGYNLMLGKGYFERMMRMYDGDTILAAAAYNGGPGMVNRALRRIGDPRKGRISHGEWTSRLPSVQGGTTETRDYVRIVHRRASRAGRGK